MLLKHANTLYRQLIWHSSSTDLNRKTHIRKMNTNLELRIFLKLLQNVVISLCHYTGQCLYELKLPISKKQQVSNALKHLCLLLKLLAQNNLDVKI